MRTVAILLAAELCSGCVSTAVGVVTLPVRAVGFTVDKLTTSRAEADRNLGRRTRREQERQARDDRREAKAEKKREREAGRAAS